MSDARPIDDETEGPHEAPDAMRRRKLRRRFVGTLLSGAFVAGSLAALFGEDGLMDLIRLRREVAEAHATTEMLRQRVAGEEKAIAKLQDEPIARERIAREKLGYAAPGETVLLLPDTPGADATAPRPKPEEPPFRAP